MNPQFFIALSVAIGIFAYTLQNWLAPTIPVLLYAVISTLMLLTLFAIARLFGPNVLDTTPPEEDPGPDHGLTIPVLAALALGLLFLASWNMAPVRKMWIAPASTLGRLVVERALDDKSLLVRTQACVHLLLAKKRPVMSTLIAAMEKSPQMGKDCLLTIAQSKPGRSKNIARMVKQRWHSNLMISTHEDDVQRSCSTLKSMTTMGTLSGKSAVPEQMQCALEAKALTTRMCCAKELAKQPSLAKALGDPQDFAISYGQKTQGSMARLTFSSSELDPKEERISSELKLNTLEMKQWVIEHGCALMSSDNQKDRRSAMRGFIYFSETNACTSNNKELRRTQNKNETWDTICELYAQTSIEEKTNIEKFLCKSMEQSAAFASIEHTKILVHAAIRAHQLTHVSLNIARAEHVGGYGSMGMHNPYAMEQRRREIRAKVRRRADGSMDISSLSMNERMILMGAKKPNTNGLMAMMLHKSPLLREAAKNPKMRAALQKSLNDTLGQGKINSFDAVRQRQNLRKEGSRKGKNSDITKFVDEATLAKEYGEKETFEVMEKIREGARTAKKR